MWKKFQGKHQKDSVFYKVDDEKLLISRYLPLTISLLWSFSPKKKCKEPRTTEYCIAFKSMLKGLKMNLNKKHCNVDGANIENLKCEKSEAEKFTYEAVTSFVKKEGWKVERE